jgi:uncharacterized protein with NRDE domain
MCLIAWNWQPDSELPLLLIGNRDEFYARPTAPLQWWEDANVLAGRDLQAGGAWLGVDRRGRLAALTNHRDPANARSDTPSRGSLVADFLRGDANAPGYIDQLASRAAEYNPFNLLLFDGQRLLGFESRSARTHALAPGVGAVSNADFNTPWPKLCRLTQGLDAALRQQASPDDVSLLTLLADRTVPADAELPRTGIALEMERALSMAFIAAPGYGTRANTIVRMGKNSVSMLERTHSAAGPGVETRFTFTL